MEVEINNTKFVLEADSSLFDALKQAGLNQKNGIAVAVNWEIISKSNWHTHILKQHDKITVITAAQGG